MSERYKMSKKSEYQAIFDEYQKLKFENPYACKSEIIRLMLGSSYKKTEFNRLDEILRRHFGIFGDQKQVQADLEDRVLAMYDERNKSEPLSVREIAKFIAESLNVKAERVKNILYRNGCFGDFEHTQTAKNKQKQPKKPPSDGTIHYQNNLAAWNSLFKDDILCFSPARYSKSQAA